MTMDLNELYYRHQISVARAAVAAGTEARTAHLGLASGYARRISDLQSGDLIIELPDNVAF